MSARGCHRNCQLHANGCGHQDVGGKEAVADHDDELEDVSGRPEGGGDPYEMDQSITTGLSEMQTCLGEPFASLLKSQAGLEAIDVPALVASVDV